MHRAHNLYNVIGHCLEVEVELEPDRTGIGTEGTSGSLPDTPRNTSYLRVYFVITLVSSL